MPADTALPLSLIIITYNRAERLAETLRAVSAQTLPAEAFEVIVVDDGPSDATRQVVQYAPTDSNRTRYLTSNRQGATLARNWGAQHARGALLVFLDDDIELGPNSLERLAAAQTANPHSVIIGRLLNPGQTPDLETGTVMGRYTQCLTGFLSVAASDFEAIGRFRDVTGGWPDWDDVEFGYRSEQAGYVLRRCLDAWAIHHDASAQALSNTARRYMAAAQAAARLFHTYPAIEAQLPMFADKGPLAWRTDPLSLSLRKLVRSAVAVWPVLHSLEWGERLTQQVAPRSGLSDVLRRWIIGGYIWQGFRRGLRELS
jgi:GT2 family glycosyltransferase